MNLQYQKERLTTLVERLYFENRKTRDYITVLNPTVLDYGVDKLGAEPKKSPEGLLEEINDLISVLENQVSEKSTLNDGLESIIFNLVEQSSEVYAKHEICCDAAPTTIYKR
jgi:hypothetical protein